MNIMNIHQNSQIDYFYRLSTLLNQVEKKEIFEFLDTLNNAWISGKRVMFTGNGGSALSALHMATDLTKGVRQATGRPLKCITPIDNIGVLTAYSNDVSYHDAFAEQVEDQLEPGDCLIAISVSARSKNLVRAVVAAKNIGARTVGLRGCDGGLLKGLCDISVVVPSTDYQLVEDIHMALGHMAMQHLSQMKAA